MNYGDASATAVVTVLALVAVVSGPLFPWVDLTHERAVPPGSGDAEVAVERPPVEELELVRGDFDAGTYHLEVKPGLVRVDHVVGNPTLKLAIDVPGVWYSDIRTYELGGRDGETVRLRFRPVDVSPKYVTDDRYDATVSLWLRSGDEYVQLYRETVSVGVRR